MTALVAGLATGCSASDPCADVTCTDGKVCEEGTCVAPPVTDKCAGKPANFCPSGTGCNPATGGCVNLCNIEGAPTCDAPLVCEPTTGQCVDKCAGKSCTEDKTCNPTNGLCESKCKNSNCSASQECVATTGQCVERCETATKPRGQAECTQGLKCDPTSGECMSACQLVVCDEARAQYCDPVSGTCKAGAPPAGDVGSACADASTCGRPDSPATTAWECLSETDLTTEPTALPGGYCTLQCAGQEDCPQGSLCLGGYCYDTCSRESDCRGGAWHCTALGGGYGACLPGTECGYEDAAKCGGIGANCELDADCANGASCFSELTETEEGASEFSGYIGGACVPIISEGQMSCGSGGVAVPISDQDETIMACFKRCTLGNITTCDVGESCTPFAVDAAGNYITACLPGGCTTNDSCSVAECTASDKTRCGSGQACNNGTCSTTDTCTADSQCGEGQKCVDGECAGTACEIGTGLCYYDCRRYETDICASFGAGSSCNQQTGRCDRGCTTANQRSRCGTNGVCVDGSCEIRCNQYTEAEVCEAGEKCNLATGICGAACTEESCGAGQACVEGRCTMRCDATTGATKCSSAKVCNAETGLCEAPPAP